MRALPFVLVSVCLAWPRPGEACGHPYGVDGPPRLVSPADGAPTDAIVVVQWIGCCYEGSGVTPDTLTHLRVAETGSEVPVVAAVSETWGTSYLMTRTVRLTPSAPLQAGIAYEVWATLPEWTPSDWLIGEFTTGAAPSTGAGPGTPVLTVDMAHADSCYDHMDFLVCCGDMTLQVFELGGAEPGLLYTLTSADGHLIGADLPAPVRGLALCDGYELEGVWQLPSAPWVINGQATTVMVVATDAAGRSSPPAALTFTPTCDRFVDRGTGPLPPASPGGGGCAVGGGRAQGAWVVLLLLVVLWRRRALLLVLAACSSSDPGVSLTAAPLCEVPPQPYKLADLARCAGHLVLDDADIYWLDGERLMRMPKCGSSAPPVQLSTTPGVLDLAVDDEALYAGVTRIPKDGGAPSQLATFPEGAQYIFVDGNWLYATTEGFCIAGQPCGGQMPLIWRIPLGGGQPESVFEWTGGQIFDLAVADGTVYFVGSLFGLPTMLERMPAGGGAAEPLVPEGTSVGDVIALDARYVYFEGEGGSLQRVPRAGGAPTTLVSGQSLDGFVVDGSDVYFRGVDGLFRVPAAGGTPTLLASDPSPTGLAVDHGALYFATCPRGGEPALWIMAK